MCKRDEKLSERFYCLNRKQLGEYWHCVNNNCDTFCLEKFDHCDVCKEFLEVFENLQDSNVFGPNESGHQPILLKVYFKGGNVFSKFRIKIEEIIDSDNWFCQKWVDMFNACILLSCCINAT